MVKRPPHSFSCEEEIVDEFRLLCGNKDTSISRELRRIMLEELSKNGLIMTKDKQGEIKFKDEK